MVVSTHACTAQYARTHSTHANADNSEKNKIEEKKRKKQQIDYPNVACRAHILWQWREHMCARDQSWLVMQRDACGRGSRGARNVCDGHDDDQKSLRRARALVYTPQRMSAVLWCGVWRVCFALPACAQLV